ncbi:MAG: hypothetical protein LKI32_07290 [Lachnospiraceae bacterium]|jgi:Na+-driven multidrug efflux pump|nr:hypothetical protein [Lachnospiraceae bacterium]MCI1657345.1 hypothetical protein [Lachnospiraceae bacterium]MCI2195823.1 hypothetical protein [Lachnospiraceae bacterium]
MREQTEKAVGNPLGSLLIAKLLPKFAVPAVISMIVSALYNMVDQIFIGWGVGVLGNAATNVAFPIPTICLSLALLAGIGGSANYNICSGKGEEEEGLKYAGNCAIWLSGLLYRMKKRQNPSFVYRNRTLWYLKRRRERL